jgi:hypothetical protein
LGHKDQFPPLRLSARSLLGQATFAGADGNGEEAPIPDPGTTKVPPEPAIWLGDGRTGGGCVSGSEFSFPGLQQPTDSSRRDLLKQAFASLSMVLSALSLPHCR